MRLAKLEDLIIEKWLRDRNDGSLYWITKNNVRIQVKDMSDEHLQNTLNMLLKKENEVEEEDESDHIGDYDVTYGEDD